MLNQETLSKEIQPANLATLRTRPYRVNRGPFWTGQSSWILGLLALLSFSMGTGCRFNKLAVNEAILVSYRDMVWAKRAYNLRYGNCDRPYGEHYYNGFCSGYSDVCNGGDGYVPALPPVAYRSSKFQSADGAQCVNAWFEGYPAGVAAARQEKVGNFNNVLVSKMIDTAVNTEKNTKRLLPSDVPIKSDGESKAEMMAPPNPDAISSIMVPDPKLPVSAPMVNQVTTADSKQPISQNISAIPGIPSSAEANRPPAPSLPPIVTGSGIVRVARGANETGGSSESAESNRRIE
jgi:hypothetical protein